MGDRTALSPMRSFDPNALGRMECAAWVGYYGKRWGRVLTAAVGMVREGFRLPWPRTLVGAVYVLRANQLWAPVPDNDPVGARRAMRRFYALVASTHGETFDVDEAARLEVEWWRLHRVLQRDTPGEYAEPLVNALAALYAHVYGVPAEQVRPCTAHRRSRNDPATADTVRHDRYADPGPRRRHAADRRSAARGGRDAPPRLPHRRRRRPGLGLLVRRLADQPVRAARPARPQAGAQRAGVPAGPARQAAHR